MISKADLERHWDRLTNTEHLTPDEVLSEFDPGISPNRQYPVIHLVNCTYRPETRPLEEDDIRQHGRICRECKKAVVQRPTLGGADD